MKWTFLSRAHASIPEASAPDMALPDEEGFRVVEAAEPSPTGRVDPALMEYFLTRRRGFGPIPVAPAAPAIPASRQFGPASDEPPLRPELELERGGAPVPGEAPCLPHGVAPMAAPAHERGPSHVATPVAVPDLMGTGRARPQPLVAVAKPWAEAPTVATLGASATATAAPLADVAVVDTRARRSRPWRALRWWRVVGVRVLPRAVRRRRVAMAALMNTLAMRGGRAVVRAWRAMTQQGTATPTPVRPAPAGPAAPPLLRQVGRHLGDASGVVLTLAVGIGVGILYARRGPVAPPPRPVSAAARVAAPVASARVLPPAPAPSMASLGTTASATAGAAVPASGSAASASVAVTTAAPPPAVSATAPAADWADSLRVPAHVLAGAGLPGPEPVTRSYRPLGQGVGTIVGAGAAGDAAAGITERQLRAAAEAAGSAPARRATAPTRVIDPALVRPRLVQRLGGSRIALYPMGPAVRNEHVADAWAVPGRCSVPLTLDASGVAREMGAMGAWVYAIAVPIDACRQLLGQRAIALAVPSEPDRRAIAEATGLSVVVRGLGAPRFSGGELRDLAVGTVGGTRMAFGVFRRAGQGTQVAPPPPEPQLAFVARFVAGRWEIVWGRYTDRSSEALALAGVYDVLGRAVPDAYFAVRDDAGGSRVLRIGTDGRQWKLLATHSLR